MRKSTETIFLRMKKKRIKSNNNYNLKENKWRFCGEKSVEV